MLFIRFQLAVLFALVVLALASKDPFAALKYTAVDYAKHDLRRSRQKFCTTCLELCGNPKVRYWNEHFNSEAYVVRRILRSYHGDRKPSDCMAICRTNLQHHMAEYIEFKIFEATQGGTKTSPDLSKEEVASVWQEADADRRKTCDGRDWKLAGSKRTYAGVPDWSHHALRREGNRRVKKKNSQDRPEAPDLDQPLSYDDVTHDEIVGGESARFRRWLTSPRHRLEELPQSMMELGGRLKDSFSSGIQSFFSGPPNPAGAPPPPYKGFQIPRPIHP